MATQNAQAKILAQGIYQIRQLLSGYLGSQAEGDTSVREAAHLAYALHNEALAILDNKQFDEKIALSKIAAVDAMFSKRRADSLAVRRNDYGVLRNAHTPH